MSNIQIKQIKAMIRCRECGGSGLTDKAPYCRDCLQPISHQELMNLSDADLMSCGHPWSRLVEEEPCGECGGSGEEMVWLSIDEFLEAISGKLLAFSSNLLPHNETQEQRWPDQTPP